MTEAGFKRIWCQPKRASRGGTLTTYTPRGRYLLEQSRARFERRPDAYLPSLLPLTGEIGTIESFRFITTGGEHPYTDLVFSHAKRHDEILRQLVDRIIPPVSEAILDAYRNSIRYGTSMTSTYTRESEYVVLLHSDWIGPI